jgi:hypothetical protein
VLLELSRRVGQESRYFQLEQYLGVTPGWGTPRSMQEVLEGQPAAAEQPVGLAAARAVAAPAAAATEPPATNTESNPPMGNTPVAAAVAPATGATPAAEAPKAGFDPMAPVSLDSLPVLPRGGRAPAVTEAPVSAAPERSAPASRPATSGSKSRALATSSDNEPEAEPAPTRSRKARDAEPEPAPVAKAKKPAPEPEGPKTAPNPHDNPLTASIRAAVRARPAKN